MPGPEASVERRVCKAALALGVANVKLSSGQGFPDRLFFLPNGATLLMEFKAKNKKPDKLQLYIHEILEEYGHHVYVCYTYEEALGIIVAALEAAKNTKARRKVSR